MSPRSVALALILGCLAGSAASQSAYLPTGQRLTPLAAPGARLEPLRTGIGPYPDYVADGASAASVSPDGRELLVLTSGFNRYNGPDGKIVPEQSVQYVFRYSIAAEGARLVQTLPVPNSYSGLAWLPDSRGFVVAGGLDDNLHLFRRDGAAFTEAGPPIALGHAEGLGPGIKPQAAGVAVSADGRHALVANYENDSVSLVDLQARRVLAEQDLRPGRVDPSQSGRPGGEFPFAIAWTSPDRAYVSAPRDRELVQLSIVGGALRISGRVKTTGEPTALLADPGRSRLYATEDNADRLAVVDLSTGRLAAEPKVALPQALAGAGIGKGLNPNALALLADHRLAITLGGINAVATAALTARGDLEVQGLVPTGWYPSAVAIDPTSRRVFVANRKSPPGANPQGCAPALATSHSQPTACGAANQYIFQLEKAALLQFRLPEGAALARTTRQVADNIGLFGAHERAAAEARMRTLRARIKHVVFIIKENRTYDQVLGDLEVGNGDPSLAILGARLSPNHHQIARQFVTLDNFYDSGEQSSTGWTWSTAARVPDLLEKTAPVNYAQRGLAYDAEETDRFIYTGQTQAERRASNPRIAADPDLLPGPALLTAPDGDRDDEAGEGFLWHAAIRKGLSVRNYGFADASVYEKGAPGSVPLVRQPFSTRTRIYSAGDRLLASRSDPYFRGFDQKMPDYWRVLEWQREFAQQQAGGRMPALTLMRLSHDHFGSFEDGIDGVNTVETEMADNDYALGLVMESIARSRFADSTVVFVIEDDTQNGADHVDARRSVALVAGAGVRQGVLVSTRYTTVNLLRTIEALLGLPPLGLNDGLAAPMADLFDPAAPRWSYRASASDALRTTKLPIAPDRFAPDRLALNRTPAQACPTRDAAYWASAMRGQDFSREDRLDTAAFNAALWRGLAGGPPPANRTGEDLRSGRDRLLDKSSPEPARLCGSV